VSPLRSEQREGDTSHCEGHLVAWQVLWILMCAVDDICWQLGALQETECGGESERTYAAFTFN
jgi:hypothetical protein